jgi:hypothetical protein
MYQPQDYYWFVGGDNTKVYSSARNIYVDAATDSDYQTFVANGDVAIDADSEAGIWHLMQDFLPLYLWNGTTFSQPAANAWTKAQLQNYNAQTRFDKVTGGMTAAGVPVKTDDRSRGLIADARKAAETDNTFTAKWYGSDGNFYAIDAATMIQLSNTVNNHTNDCYNTFSQVDGEILANTVTTLAQIDTAYQGL